MANFDTVRQLVSNTTENIQSTIQQAIDLPEEKLSSWRKNAKLKKNIPLLWLLFQFLWKHGVIVFLIALPILMISFMPQGQDLRMNLFATTDELATLSDFIRILWLLLMLLFLGYAIWVIPQFYIDYESPKSKSRKPPDMMAKSVSSDFLRVLSVTPLLIYGSIFFIQMLSTDQYIKKVSWLYWLLNLLIFVVIIFIFLWNRKSDQSISTKLLSIAFVLTVLVVPFLFYINLKPDNPAVSYALLGNGMLVLALMQYSIFHRLENLKSQPNAENNASLFYYGFIILAVIKVIILLQLEDTLKMATIPVVIFFNAFYLLLLNLVAYHFKIISGWGKLVYVLFIVVVFISIHMKPSSAHYVQYKSVPNELPESSYAAFEKAWVEENVPVDDPDFIIYLIAGEGGGSRAGFWTTKIWSELDLASDFTFSERVYAMSGVSGSSAGASAYYKWLRYLKENPNDTLRIRQLTPKFSNRVFSNNFLTGSVIRLLTVDLFNSVLPFYSRKGRNLRLQQEENYAFLKALQDSSMQFPMVLKDMESKDSLIYQSATGGSGKLPNDHFTTFAGLYKKDQILDIRFPLLLFNTAHIQTGKRGIVAPVAMDSTVFFDVIDVNSGFGKSHRSSNTGHKSLMLGTANNLSELFPIFSAYTYVDSLGNYIDGGIFENKGITTIMEVYHHLRNRLDSMQRSKVGIRILVMENGSRYDNAKDHKPAFQLWALFQNLYARPFKAHTEAAKKEAIIYFSDLKARKDTTLKDNIVFISLADCNKDSSLMVPLARDLSCRSIHIMDSCATRNLNSIKHILKEDKIFKNDWPVRNDCPCCYD